MAGHLGAENSAQNMPGRSLYAAADVSSYEARRKVDPNCRVHTAGTPVTKPLEKCRGTCTDTVRGTYDCKQGLQSKPSG